MKDVTDEAIDHVFTYHAPDDVQKGQYERIREKAKELAKQIVADSPASADRSAALRKLREAVMTANAAIALRGAVVLLLGLLLAVAPAAAAEKKVQVFGDITAFYLDSFGIAGGPRLEFPDRSAVSFQLMLRHAMSGRPDTTTQFRCRTFPCAGCSNPDEVGFAVTYSFGKLAKKAAHY